MMATNPWDVVSVTPAAQPSGGGWDVVQQAPKKPMGYGEMLGQAVVNTPDSAGRMISGLYEAVTSPVQTVSG